MPSSSSSTRRRRDPSAAQYQRGLKGLPFEAPFDPDDEAIARQAYDAGADERAQQETRRKRKTATQSKRARTRARVRTHAKTSRRYYRRATRQLRNPVQRQLTTGSQVLILALAIVGLYLVLQTSDKVGGFLGGITRAVQWLADPTTSIPHKPN